MYLKKVFVIIIILCFGAFFFVNCTEESSSDGCPEWYQIKSSNAGDIRCTRGIVKRTMYDMEQDFSYVFFSGDVNEFFIGFEGNSIGDVTIGECYMATGLVEETEFGTPYIMPDDFSRCRAELQVAPTESTVKELPIQAADFDLSDCMSWDQVELSDVGQQVCIMGTAWTTNFEDDEYGGFFYIEFGGTLEDVYFAVDGADLAGVEGHCVVATGILEKEEGWDIPYLWIYPEDLYHCD